MTKSIVLLGSTGSIGTQALEVAKHLGIEIKALSAFGNHKLLEKQCREFRPEKCWISEEHYQNLKTALADTNIKVLTGNEQLCALASETDATLVFNSLLGISGLSPTLAAIEAKKKLALANKETLVAGGSLVMKAAFENKVDIIPVDSEHSAIFQCLQGQQKPEKLILTASGGTFYGRNRASLENVTVEETLKHPNWNMGAKITVDSATLMNKGLEFIEAAHLFSMDADKIDVVIHRESIIHSMVEFTDGSIIAQLGSHDMRIPIQYAITYPQRRSSLAKKLDFTAIGVLNFAKPDYENFPLLKLAMVTFNNGGIMPAVMNGANEAAVALFLNKKISFNNISDLVISATENIRNKAINSVDDIFEADLQARQYVYSKI
ncbi:MAG: 1-deoxy-D-xylulose-5-phosphate reductoisomerase [Eubacteriales bacterium]|nr:1-deoxy-D-xylulose-5-phosphate reductoisomerase [Eubacteriales bacterium]MDD4474587.1 1-deoxy-D-xylulose-5-phosphate reductoisomerase [Eubacteriales bacterium]